MVLHILYSTCIFYTYIFYPLQNLHKARFLLMKCICFIRLILEQCNLHSTILRTFIFVLANQFAMKKQITTVSPEDGKMYLETASALIKSLLKVNFRGAFKSLDFSL